MIRDQLVARPGCIIFFTVSLTGYLLAGFWNDSDSSTSAIEVQTASQRQGKEDIGDRR